MVLESEINFNKLTKRSLRTSCTLCVQIWQKIPKGSVVNNKWEIPVNFAAVQSRLGVNLNHLKVNVSQKLQIHSFWCASVGNIQQSFNKV